MSQSIPLFRLKKEYYENSSNSKYLEFLADMGKIKVPFRLLRSDYRKTIFEEAEKGIDEDIEAALGKERADEFREWIEGMKGKYSYSLPEILGEDFSYNILTLFFVVFLRYLYNRYIDEKKKNRGKTPFVEEIERMRLIQDILREGLWYKKAPTFASRPLSFQSHPAETRKEGSKILIVFLKALLDSDFVCGKKENINRFRKYLESWLNLSLEDDFEKKRYREIEKFFKKMLTGDFKEWFERNFNVELIQGSCLWFKTDRHKTVLNARCQRALWVTKRIAKKLGVEMSEDDLFPRIRKEEEDRIKKWVEEFSRKKYA